MSRITVKELEEQVRILRQRVLELEKRILKCKSPYEVKPKKCPCCGQIKNPYKNIYDYVKYKEFGHNCNYDRKCCE